MVRFGVLGHCIVHRIVYDPLVKINKRSKSKDFCYIDTNHLGISTMSCCNMLCDSRLLCGRERRQELLLYSFQYRLANKVNLTSGDRTLWVL